jgi:hypothetical protein
MASSTMQTCHLPRETRLAPRKPVAYSQRKMPANRVSNPRRDCWPQLPRKLHHPPGGAPKAPRVRGSRSLLAAAAGQKNSIPQRLVEIELFSLSSRSFEHGAVRFLFWWLFLHRRLRSGNEAQLTLSRFAPLRRVLFQKGSTRFYPSGSRKSRNLL